MNLSFIVWSMTLEEQLHEDISASLPEREALKSIFPYPPFVDNIQCPKEPNVDPTL
jgi:hypothetical protein